LTLPPGTVVLTTRLCFWDWENKLVRNTTKAFALIAGLVVAQNATAANLLVNGGFETPTVLGQPNVAYFNVPAGSPLITGWTIVQGNVDLTHTCCYGPGINTTNPSSVQAVDLVGDTRNAAFAFGGLSQSFATVVGQEYRLSFAYSHNNGTFSPDYAVQVTVADANAPAGIVLSVEKSQAFNQLGWLLFSQTFIANSDSMLLKFINTRGAFNAGIYLDDVSVESVLAPVPLPAALPLFATTLAGGGLIAWRRKRKASRAIG